MDGRQSARTGRRRLPDVDGAERWRLFVAAPLPAETATRAWTALSPTRAKHPDVRWLTPEKLHLTLVFLGQTEASRIASLADAIAAVAIRHAPFAVATGDAGGRVGGRRGGVAWLRLADGATDVARLSTDIDDAFGTHTYDARSAPRPHLTVARRATADALAELRAVAVSIRLTWTVDRVVLFRSHTGPTGSRYEELGSTAL